LIRALPTCLRAIAGIGPLSGIRIKDLALSTLQDFIVAAKIFGLVQNTAIIYF
jgi:hypothetical protein